MRRLSPVMVIATLAFLAGCGPMDRVVIRETDWPEVRKSDIGCSETMKVIADYYDLNGDGLDEAFLTMWCPAKGGPVGRQFEIVAGDADVGSTHPTKLVLQTSEAAAVDRVCFRNGTVIYRVTPKAGRPRIWQVRWTKGDPAPEGPKPGPAGGCP